MSQELRDSKMKNDVESYNAIIDREDKIYGRIGVIFIIIALFAAGTAYLMMIKELFIR